MRRDKHSLSHYTLTSTNMGTLTPVACVPVLPGDTFRHQTNCLIRVSPLVTPVMHPVQVRVHHFYVPLRIVWPEFEDFITGGPDGNNADEIPTLTNTNVRNLYDYLGVEPGTQELSALPIWCVNKIWNEYYRDQDLQDEREADDLTLPFFAWEKDYFTSSRPFTQKGDQVTLPVGSKAVIRSQGGALTTGNQYAPTLGAGENPPPESDGYRTWRDPDTGNEIFADLADTDGIQINDFRRAFALQRYKEARAMYGSRYTEYLRYLGIRPSDARLQRPEYLGGGKQIISFSEVLQTASDDIGQEQTPVGTLRGHGIAALRSNRYRKFFEEHGYVITFLSVRPKTMYTNGVPRHFLHRTKEDLFQKELEAIGQQEVYNQEVYSKHSNPDGVFGYNNRYEDYRRIFSYVSAEMRNQLDSWHLSRTFESEPALNSDFVRCDATKRIHAVQTEDVLWCMVNHSIQARRQVRRNVVNRIL